MTTNHFSGWMGKGGVLPLLRSRAFLFLPARLARMALRFFVTRVLETIDRNLQRPLRQVKGIVTAIALIPMAALGKGEAKSIILAIGQHKELKLASSGRYTVGNHGALSHKYIKKCRCLLVKGKHMGFSEVVLWGPSGDKKVYHFYVVNKKRHLKILHLMETLKGQGLQTRLTGPMIVVAGEIKQRHVHRLILRLERDNPNDLHILASFSLAYRRRLLGEIYKKLFDEYVDHFECHTETIHILCHHPKDAGPSDGLKKFLQKNYNVTFLPLVKKRQLNYLLKLKLVQLEKLNGEELNLGLGQISGTLDELFLIGVAGMVRKNEILLREQNIDFSTLAEPQTIVRLNHPAHIEVGAEIPYKSTSTINPNMVNTHWKFAGLKINVKLKGLGGKLSLDYKTQFTRPTQDGSIAGNKESSSAMIVPGKPLRLFEILFKTTGREVIGLPWISRIPILGHLFRSKSHQSNFKNITAVVVLRELKDRGR